MSGIRNVCGHFTWEISPNFRLGRSVGRPTRRSCILSKSALKALCLDKKLARCLLNRLLGFLQGFRILMKASRISLFCRSPDVAQHVARYIRSVGCWTPAFTGREELICTYGRETGLVNGRANDSLVALLL